MSHTHTSNTLCRDYCFGSMELEIGVTLSHPTLEDATAGKGIRCKKQKLSSCSKEQKVDSLPSCSTIAKPLHEGKWKKIAYPFELVKRGGVEGETTLKDINNQILMIPLASSKRIPHLVEDSATHSCTLDRGFGMSGKEVVSLIRIPTKASGSITIIRTKD